MLLGTLYTAPELLLLSKNMYFCIHITWFFYCKIGGQDVAFLHELLFDALIDDKQGMVEALIEINQLNLEELKKTKLEDLYDKVKTSVVLKLTFSIERTSRKNGILFPTQDCKEFPAQTQDDDSVLW